MAGKVVTLPNMSAEPKKASNSLHGSRVRPAPGTRRAKSASATAHVPTALPEQQQQSGAVTMQETGRGAGAGHSAPPHRQSRTSISSGPSATATPPAVTPVNRHGSVTSMSSVLTSRTLTRNDYSSSAKQLLSRNTLKVLEKHPRPTGEVSHLDSEWNNSFEQNICLDLLRSGNVDAYVNVFSLTQNLPDLAFEVASAGRVAFGIPVPAEGAEDAEADESLAEQTEQFLVNAGWKLPSSIVPRIVTPPTREELARLRTLFIAAEEAEREGATDDVFIALKSVALHFEKLKQWQVAVHYHGKCLLIARKDGDHDKQLKACRALGLCYDEIGEFSRAVRYYEQCLSIAELMAGDDELYTAKKLLVTAYERHAAKLERLGEFEAAIVFARKCQSLAESNQDQEAVAECLHRIGVANEKLRRFKEAIESYKAAEVVCQEIGDASGRGAASAAQARAYHASGDVVSAVAYLEQYLALARETGQLRAQAEACGYLGVIYNTKGDFASAERYFTMNYEMAKELGDKAMMNVARVNLGISRGNANMGQYMALIKTPQIDTLLGWKNKRDPFVVDAVAQSPPAS